MILADTSIWVEFLRYNEAIFSVMAKHLENQEILAMECIFAELLQGAKDQREISIIYDYWKNLPKVDESGILLQAGEFSGRNKLISKGIGLVDTAIIVLARKTASKVWTLDKKLLRCLEPEDIYNA